MTDLSYRHWLTWTTVGIEFLQVGNGVFVIGCRQLGCAGVWLS